MTEKRFDPRGSEVRWAGRFSLFILLASVVSGCLDAGEPLYQRNKPTADNTVPLEISYVYIGEAQYATNAPIYQYTGHIEFPFCVRNPNSDVMVQEGYEVYQVLGPPNQLGLRLVRKWDSGAELAPGGFTSVPAVMAHAVLVNETLEGDGSTNYAIHIWHQILVPEPVHRQDRWFNMTFIPYHPGFTVYEEGTPC